MVIGLFPATLPSMFILLVIVFVVICVRGFCLVGTSCPFADLLSFSLFCPVLIYSVRSRSLCCKLVSLIKASSFYIVVSSSHLCQLTSSAKLNATLHRSLMELADFNFTITFTVAIKIMSLMHCHECPLKSICAAEPRLLGKSFRRTPVGSTKTARTCE